MSQLKIYHDLNYIFYLNCQSLSLSQFELCQTTSFAYTIWFFFFTVLTLSQIRLTTLNLTCNFVAVRWQFCLTEIWGLFYFSHIFSFITIEVVAQVEYSICQHLSFVTVWLCWQLEFCHKLSYVTIWVCQNFSFVTFLVL